MLQIQDLPNVIILSGSSGSNLIPIADDAFGVGIQAPATLTASQAQIWVSASGGKASAFAQLLSGGTPVVLAANQYVEIAPIVCRQLMIQSTSLEGADRTFMLNKIVQI